MQQHADFKKPKVPCYIHYFAVVTHQELHGANQLKQGQEPVRLVLASKGPGAAGKMIIRACPRIRGVSRDSSIQSNSNAIPSSEDEESKVFVTLWLLRHGL